MINLKQIGQGRSADIFENEDNKIIKLYKMDFPEDAINQEFLISKYVFSLNINTPQPFNLTQLENRHGIIFRRVVGFTLLNLITKRPWSISKHSRILASLHNNLHSYNAIGVLRQQKKVLSDNIQAASFLTDEEKKKLIDYLGNLPDGDRLCHGDFHPDNVLIGEKSWIIDWMNGTSGNPAGDVARSIILIEYGAMPDGTAGFIKWVINFLRGRMKKEYIRYYLKLSEQKYSDIDSWILPVAAARLVEWIPKEEQDKLLLVIRERLRVIK
jgi:uncharacterized protein (TIGR02172 family)